MEHLETDYARYYWLSADLLVATANDAGAAPPRTTHTSTTQWFIGTSL